GTRRLLVDAIPVTPPDVPLRAVVHASGDGVVFSANALDEPTELHVWRWTADDGASPVTSEPGVHSANASGDTIVVRSSGLDHDGARTWIAGTDTELASYAETPLVEPNVTIALVGSRHLAAALLLPRGTGAGA